MKLHLFKTIQGHTYHVRSFESKSAAFLYTYILAYVFNPSGEFELKRGDEILLRL